MKNLIITLLSIGLYTATNAQQQPILTPAQTKLIADEHLSKDDVSWGLTAGWSHANLYGKEIDLVFASNETKYKAGFHVGLYVDSRMSKHVGLKNELQFSNRHIGIVWSDEEDVDYKSTLSMSSLELIPFNVTYNIGRIQLQGGPYIAGLISASVNRKDENGKFFKDKAIYGDAANDESESKYLQKFDFGANVGIAHQFSFGLTLGLRYAHGFTDIFQGANSYGNEESKHDNIKIYNKALKASLSYPLSRK